MSEKRRILDQALRILIQSAQKSHYDPTGNMEIEEMEEVDVSFLDTLSDFERDLVERATVISLNK